MILNDVMTKDKEKRNRENGLSTFLGRYLRIPCAKVRTEKDEMYFTDLKKLQMLLFHFAAK